jgi:hypothetical protein
LTSCTAKGASHSGQPRSTDAALVMSRPRQGKRQAGQALQSFSAMRLPLAAQKGRTRWQAEQVRLVSGPGAPQNRQSH